VRLLETSLAAAMVLMATGAGTAQADETGKACAASFEKSQYLMKDGKFRAAQVDALSCSADSCPTFVREACQKVLADIDSGQPTVVFAAQDASGADLVDVRVELDGQPFVARLSAEAVPIDPGAHTLRLFHGDEPPIDQQVLVRVGEKNRLVRATFWARSKPPTPIVPDVPAGQTTRGPVWPAIVVGVGGLASIGVSIGVGVSAKSDVDHLRDTCAPHCASSTVSDVNTRVVASDVLLGVGVVAVGVAAAMYLLRSDGHEAPPVALHLTPTPSGFALAF
jgi:hypothetical protein